MPRLRVLPLGLVCLLLCGCAPLRQSYLSVTPHDKQTVSEADSSAIRVEDYPSLVSAIYGLVSQGQEEGLIRLHNYTRNVAADLSSACDEVSHEDPLGAYAVDGIKHSFKRILTYYEVAVTISYRRSPEQISSVVTVTGSGAIRAELSDTLAAFRPEVALRINYFSEGAEYIEDLVRRAYYDTPAAAMGLPQFAVSLYPDQGSQRIVEVVFTYPESTEALQKKSVETQDAAQALVDNLPKPTPRGDVLAGALYRALRQRCLDTGLLSTAHAALVGGEADSQGMALGFKLLCDLTGLECQVAQGRYADGTVHFWTIVAVEDGYLHVDPSSEEGLLLTDGALADLGLDWDREAYPVCGPPEAVEVSKEIQENT